MCLQGADTEVVNAIERLNNSFFDQRQRMDCLIRFHLAAIISIVGPDDWETVRLSKEAEATHKLISPHLVARI
jgi:hypothetical protein